MLVSWYLKLLVKLWVLEALPLICDLANEAMRWPSQSSCFVRWVFFILIRILDLQKSACVELNRKKSVFKHTLQRCTNMLYGSGNALWVTKLIIDSVHFWQRKSLGWGVCTPWHLPYRYWSEIGSALESWMAHPPPLIPRNNPLGRKLKV